MNPPLDPYRVLQILPDADQEEIKVAFRRLARRYHPDRAPDAASMARMIEVNRAWELIGDPGRRAAYDRAHGIIRGPRPVERSGKAPDAGTDEGSTATPADPPATRASGDATGAHTAGSNAGPGAGDPSARTSGASGASAPSAGPPPGRPSGTVLTFGRYEGWSLGEIARVDREYLEWLVRMPIGWQHGDEIRALLGGSRPEAPPSSRSEPRRRFPFGR